MSDPFKRLDLLVSIGSTRRRKNNNKNKIIQDEDQLVVY